MAEEEDLEQLNSLRFSDSVLLYSNETSEFVFSELSSSQHNSVALFGVDPQKKAPFPNVHFATFKVVAANKYTKQERRSELQTFFKEQASTPEDEDKRVTQLAESARELEEERRENEAEQERQTGKSIVYGEVVQLLHTLTKKYLYVNTTEIARTESKNLRMELKEVNDLGCHFRILPLNAAHSIGDVVSYDDQIKVESVKKEGWFLHCSFRTFQKKFPVYADYHELNLSVSESFFSLIPHYCTGSLDPPNAFKAGKAVHLFHKKLECYATASGSFTYNQMIAEDVHCCKLHSEYDISKDPSIPVSTYWQFEKESDPLSGQPLFWGERCRIKHMPTRRYLAVVSPTPGDYRVTLKDWNDTDVDQLDTVFILSPVKKALSFSKTKGTILLNNSVQFKHSHTSTWLHLQKCTHYDADLFQLTASTNQSSDDAFKLEQVEESLLDKFNYVAGIIPVLTTHIKESNVPGDSDSLSREYYPVECALKELANFFMAPASSRDREYCQKLLRSLTVLPLIVEMINIYTQKHMDGSEQKKVYQAGLAVIENYLKGDSQRSENYLPRFIDLFKQQMEMSLNAEEVVFKMLPDNITAITKITDIELEGIIQQLLDTTLIQEPCFIQLLSNLCIHSGRPISQKQNTLLEKLVLQHGEEVLYQTEIGDPVRLPETEQNVVYIRKPKSHDWRKLTEIAGHIAAQKRHNGDFQYLQAQLYLFKQVCRGNNAKSISTLDKTWITFNEALLCVKDDSLSPSIRSQYAELIEVMYVDVCDNSAVLENLPNSFTYMKVVEDPYAETGADDETALTGVVNPHCPKLKEWIGDHLSQHVLQREEDAPEALPYVQPAPLIASCLEENMLLAQVLSVLSSLVKFGYYTDKHEMENVMKHLIAILDGTTDIPSKIETDTLTRPSLQLNTTEDKAIKRFRRTGRFQQTAENQAIFAVKKRAMEVMELFYNFRSYIRLQQFIFEFRLLRSDMGMVEQRRPDERHGSQCLLLDTEEHKTALSRECVIMKDLLHNDTKILENPKLVNLVLERLILIFAESSFFFEVPSYMSSINTDLPQFTAVMLDLANYRSDDLIQGSLHLLNQFYSAEINLFSKAIQAQLLVTQSSLNVFETITGHLCNLRRLLSVDGGEAGRSQIISILQTFTDMCTLNGREQEAHPQNQQILYSSGVLTDVLNYVLHTEDRATIQLEAHPKEAVEKGLQRKRAPHPSSIEAVFASCFNFLRVMAHNNNEVQQRLYDRLNDLLEVNVAVEYMSRMLTEVFTGSPEISFKVKADQIQKIFTVIASGHDLGTYELINTLQAMAKIASVDVPVKRNQSLIISYFGNCNFCDHLLGMNNLKVRMSLLQEEPNEDLDLQLLLNIANLLATCAEGDNLSIQSACQGVFNTSELLMILRDPRITSGRKRPFARFLVYVYLKTGGNKNKSGQTDLKFLEDSSEMWAYLQQVADVMHKIGEFLLTLSTTECTSVCDMLSASHYTASKRESDCAINDKFKASPFVDEQDGEIFIDVLLYVCDGVLPVLHFYFDKFFNPDVLDKEKLTITGNILTTLLHFSRTFIKCFPERAQVKLYHSTVKTVLKKVQEEGSLDFNQQTTADLEVTISGWLPHFSHDKEVYLDRYAVESDLNETFNTFTTNFQLAYHGPNTARHQIGAKYNTTYSTYLDVEMKRPGDEYLPLGPSFQDHVQLYINNFTEKNRGFFRKKIPVNAELIVAESAERLLAQLEISFDKLEGLGEAERCRQDELDIKCLQILRAIIHNEIMRIGPEDLKETDTTTFRRRCRLRLHPIQNRIQNFDNAVARVVPLLIHPNDDVVREVLAFLKAILYSGNLTVQQGMQHILNTQDEKLFIIIKALLQNAASAHRERQVLSLKVKEREDEDVIFKESADHYYGKEPPNQQQTEQVEVVIEVMESPSDSDSVEAIEMDLLHLDQPQGLSVATLSPRRHSAYDISWIEVSNKDKQTAEALRLQDSSNIKLALHLLGLMCDAQYRRMQHYLREQPDDTQHFNIVKEIVLFLQVYCSELNEDSVELVHLILQALIKLCLGNFPNQEVVFNCNIIDAINSILELRGLQTSTEIIKDLVNLKASAVQLLEVMLEETDKKSKELAKKIYMTVNINALHRALAFFYRMMRDSHVRKRGFGDKSEKGLFTTYHVLVHLADYPDTCPLEKLDPRSVKANMKLRRRDGTVKAPVIVSGATDAWQFCKKRSKSIEVKYENVNHEKILTKVHFSFDLKNRIREEVIEKVKWNVNRDSPEEKQRDFLEWMLATSKDVIHYSRLRKHWLTHIMISKPNWRYWILLFLSLLLNIFLLITFSLPNDSRDPPSDDITFHDASGVIVPMLPVWYSRAALYFVGCAHLLFSVWMAIDYFIVNKPNFILPSRISWLLDLLFSKCGYHKPNETTYSDVNILGLRTLYIAVFLLASGLSLVFYGYFYAFCLLHIIVNNDILQRVLQAIIKNGISLLWVAILTLVVIYIYAVVSFAFLHESFLAENDDAVLFCNTLFQCFISVIRYGLLDNLGLIVPLVPSQWETAGLRLLFDISFFILVTTIGLNIVFGIIVDTFSELRDERFRAQQDSKSFCFICGIPSSEFERKSKGFNNHVKWEHNMWDYIYFSIYLDSIDIRDQNAMESYVYRMIENKDTSFFPLLEARALESGEDDSAEHLEEFKSLIESLIQSHEEERQKSEREARAGEVGGAEKSSS